MTHPICTTAIAMAGASLALQLVAAIKGAAPTAAPGSDPVNPEPAPVAITSDPAPSPLVPPRPKPTTNRSGLAIKPVTAGREWNRLALVQLCREHRIHNAKWRATAKKAALADALINAGVTHA